MEAVRKTGAGGRPIVYKKGRRPAVLAPGYEVLNLPCGQCTGCRLEKSRIWAARLMHEAAWLEEFENKYSTFITLTYDDENLPYGGQLVKNHFQDFMKRLRWYVLPEKVRYYAVGEYGATCPDHEIVECTMCGPLQRPHFHAIILGWSFDDKIVVGSRDGESVYTSEQLASAWTMGSHEIGSCSFESCAYVSRYIMKKISGDANKVADHYCKYLPKIDTWIDLEPEFAIMSRRPGIGKRWFDEFVSDIYPADVLPIPGRGCIGKPPPYYDELYGRENGEELVEIKEERRKAMTRSLLEGPCLESRAKVEDARLSLYKRNL